MKLRRLIVSFQHENYVLEHQGIRKKRGKKGKLKKIVRDRKVDILLLQETKQISITNFFVNSIWGHSNFEFMSVDAEGNL